MQNLNFSYRDAYMLPVWQRIWFIGKLKENLEKQTQQQNQSLNKQNPNLFKKSF